MSRGGAPSGYPGDWQSGRNPDATECAGSHGTLNPGLLHLTRMPSSLSHFFLPAILGGVALPTVVGTPTSPWSGAKWNSQNYNHWARDCVL
jgi:hypothetical protein